MISQTGVIHKGGPQSHAIAAHLQEAWTTNLGEILLGACLVGVSMLAFRIALPREGFVRPFLRNDDVQA